MRVPTRARMSIEVEQKRLKIVKQLKRIFDPERKLFLIACCVSILLDVFGIFLLMITKQSWFAVLVMVISAGMLTKNINRLLHMYDISMEYISDS